MTSSADAAPQRAERAERAERGLRVEVDLVPASRWQEALGLLTDYRGDATLERRDATTLLGYVFDCSATALRVMPQDGSSAVTVAIDEVAAFELTGRDTAAGKSFETWIRKWAESRAGT